jgi:hypothetical protein
MNEVLDARTRIYDWFQSSSSMQSHFSQTAQQDAYAAYYTSMYLIQDTAESVSSICSAGFSSDPLRAYIELWGTLQALIIQQDAINELNEAVTGQQSRQPSGAWQEIRTLRNEIAGHPVAQGNKSPPKRSFLGRPFGNLDQIAYEQYQSGSKPNGTVQDTQHRSINLRALIDRYDNEAATVLDSVFAHMKKEWPKR